MRHADTLSACCRHTVTIYRGTTAEGTVLLCIWCRRTLAWREGMWELKEEEG
ncbi:MAG TPA: hypothetical protein VGX03_06370 [Candidatus Binatia bacterium]|jgi:hypothetical protein|nr:hypothetical protein [Candidatus Binatia bacterium]